MVLVEIRLQRHKKAEAGLQTLEWTLSQEVFVKYQNTLRDDWNPQKETGEKTKWWELTAISKVDQQETYQLLKQKHCRNKQMQSDDEALLTEIDDKCWWEEFIFFLLWKAWCDACKKVAIEQEILLKEETHKCEAMF